MLIPCDPSLRNDGRCLWAPPEDLPQRQTRVVICFDRDADVPCDDDGAAASSWLGDHRGEQWKRASGDFRGARLRRLHGRIEAGRLDEFHKRNTARRRGGRPPFRRWFEMDAEDFVAAQKLATSLRGESGLIARAYVSRFGPPPGGGGAPPFGAGPQPYRDAAPGGIGAADVVDFPGADGQGVHLIDIEMGWHLDHPDLGMAGKAVLLGKELSNFEVHGTAVLGVLRGQGTGCFGIVPRCDVDVASQIRKPNGVKPVDRLEETILQMIDRCSPGDVLLVEAQAEVDIGERQGVYAPVEVEPGVFDAIRAAVDAGIIVIEPGGNGATNPAGENANDHQAIDLDAWKDANGRLMLDRDDGDSGAILVSAGLSDRSNRTPYAPSGGRVDCHAWGDSIGTCKSPTVPYFPSDPSGFRGTSGAAAIVAGAAVALQGMRRGAGLPPLTPDEMRKALGNPNLNTPLVKNGAPLAIGPMPNLLALSANLTHLF